MMNEGQLYIDGVLVDSDKDTKVTLDLKSNILKGYNIESNASYTIKLPKTVRNRRLLGYSDMIQAGVVFPYGYHTARYFRNGVEIISDGRAALLEATDDAFEVAIWWGLFPALTDLIASGATLNQLESVEKILFGNNNVSTYAEAVAANVFYADIDTERYEESEADTSWVNGKRGTVVSVALGGNGNVSGGVFSRAAGGGTSGGSATDATILLHPCCKVSWILEMIREQKGVEFRWTGEAKSYIDTLILPVINKKATEDSYDGAFAAAVMRTTASGYVNMTVQVGATMFEESVGTISKTLTVAADGGVYVTVSCQWTRNMAGAAWQTRSRNSARTGKSTSRSVMLSSVPFLVLVVMRGTETAEYQIGSSKTYAIYDYECVNNVYTGELCGEGLIELQRGDKLMLELRDSTGESFSLVGSLASFIGGTITAAATESDEVPKGGYYPIAVNLPEVKVVDFVKFLSILTGTFPLNRFRDGVVDFVALADVWSNVSRAKDWTRRLIAPKGENNPQDMTFAGDFCQHNRFKWKNDEEVKGSYDGDMTIENDTLDLERTVMEFPFAATDGNNVPLYTRPETSSSSSSGSGSSSGGSGVFGNGDTMSQGTDDSTNTSTDDLTDNISAEFDECEPRILRLYDNDGKAGAVFDMDMQNIITEKYADLVRTLQSMKVIKESIRISDIELKEFDETVPVYLAQYGCYFAVIEIKAEDNGLAEVTMLQLIIS